MTFLEKAFYTAYFYWVQARCVYNIIWNANFPRPDFAEMGKEYWIGDHTPLPEIDNAVQRP